MFKLVRVELHVIVDAVKRFNMNLGIEPTREIPRNLFSSTNSRGYYYFCCRF